ncbi:hypothetical protein J1605_015482 [Eschrichtius robustus]|uniref:Uncharacterized protein n=1 Tax=Eschrichtius robustus TaxID=9764 RepID=A0AB34G9M7_ESCRO|nr:hypothetical protein J1605_015482 [Eschrichtius robustus]
MGPPPFSREASAAGLDIAMIKMVAPSMANRVIDHSILEQALVPGPLGDEGSPRASPHPALCLPGLRSSRAEQQLPTGSVLHLGPSPALCPDEVPRAAVAKTELKRCI